MNESKPNQAEPPMSEEARRPPTPMRRLPRVLKVVAIAAGGTGLFVLVNGMLTPTMGAQRSTRLQWEQRQQDIDQAIAKADQVQP